MKIDESVRGNTSNEKGCVFVIVGILDCDNTSNESARVLVDEYD